MNNDSSFQELGGDSIQIKVLQKLLRDQQITIPLPTLMAASLEQLSRSIESSDARGSKASPTSPELFPALRNAVSLNLIPSRRDHLATHQNWSTASSFFAIRLADASWGSVEHIINSLLHVHPLLAVSLLQPWVAYTAKDMYRKLDGRTLHWHWQARAYGSSLAIWTLSEGRCEMILHHGILDAGGTQIVLNDLKRLIHHQHVEEANYHLVPQVLPYLAGLVKPGKRLPEWFTCRPVLTRCNTTQRM